jgi:ornithine--oxo-acid transaminase
VDIDPALMTGREACERLMAVPRTPSSAHASAGVLAKDTHGATIRLAPPLVVTEDDIRFAVARLAEVVAG